MSNDNEIVIKQEIDEEPPLTPEQIFIKEEIVEEGLFPCEICGKRLKTLSALKNHSNVHVIVLHKCDICGVQYRRRRYLNAHLKLHNTDQEFPCEHCTKTFKTESYLKRHVIRVHAEKTVSVPSLLLLCKKCCNLRV